jgi:DNA mismatch repair protein MutS2
MIDMNEKTLQLLEYGVIIRKAASCALSAEAAEEIMASLPLTDEGAVRSLKERVSSVLDRMNAKDGPPEKREAIPSLGAVLPKLAVEGATLELDEAYALAVFIERGSALKAWLSAANKNEQESKSGAPAELGEGMPDCGDVAADIFRVIDKEGNLRDLPEFRELRRRIQAITKDLETAGSRYVSNEETRRMLQSAVPSQRDGRLVLAVKANFRGRIRGIVHEVSATGQTIFIEPEEVVEKNNDLLIENRRLAAEIQRVLRELSSRVALRRDDIGAFHR